MRKNAAEVLKRENIEPNEENIFIALACKEKGIAFLKGEGKVMVRKKADMPKATSKNNAKKCDEVKTYSVLVNGNSYNVQVAEGESKFAGVKSVAQTPSQSKPAEAPKAENKTVSSGDSNEVLATLPSNVFKILVKIGDKVSKGQNVVILEAMKMEINIESPKDGVIKEILVNQGDTVDSNQVLAIVE